ncbi:hypothetical protein [Streptomyces sp. NBC_01190]|jgi:hypothetical protein|uniref:hypothetical protein n=1 Tax=Streptomyces sp. NBC_01190 TaxID=2903767 RepID=UPI00386509AB|nr:hypothetical protein OG519_27100 [Streptomyces sp. NBC_01190]
MTTIETDTDSLLGRLLGIPEAEEFLAWPGDFEPSRAGHGEEIRLRSGAPLQAIAGDSGGGTYYQVGVGHGTDRPVLYASSEGEGGLIAESLPEALELLIGLPYWQDCLPGRDFPLVELEAEYRSTFPDLDRRRDRVAELLGLGRPAAPALVERLHTSVGRSFPEYLPVAASGEPFTPLS